MGADTNVNSATAATNVYTPGLGYVRLNRDAHQMYSPYWSVALDNKMVYNLDRVRSIPFDVLLDYRNNTYAHSVDAMNLSVHSGYRFKKADYFLKSLSAARARGWTVGIFAVSTVLASTS